MSDVQRQNGERKACDTCARAKAKCIFPTSIKSGDVKCERCVRLKKPCSPQAAPAKRRKPPKPNVSRGFQVEQKLDNIVNLLAAREGADDGQPKDIRPPRFPQRLNKGINWGSGMGLNSDWRPVQSVTAGEPIGNMEFAEFILPNVKLKYEEMEKLVDSWRPQLAEHFPFAALYDGQSTQYLLVEMPFLATAISCAALYGDLPRQIEVAQALIKEIGEHMLLKGEKSLDLLLGILVLVAWYHWHVFCNPQVSNLHHLAAALLVDLGLNRPPDRLRRQKFQLFSLRFVHGPSAHRDLRSMSERRALVGCYYMSNVLWSTFKKLNSTPWSEHIEESVETLSEAQELPSDILLVYLVKGQRLLESVELGLGISDPDSNSAESATHVLLYVSSFVQDLKKLREEMPPHVRDNTSIKITYLEVEAIMYHIAFSHLNALRHLQKDDPKTRSIKRLEYLKSSLQACKGFFDSLLVISPAQYYRHSFHTWARFCRVLMVVARISQTEDLRGVEIELGAIVDFSTVVDRFSNNFDQAEAAAKAEGLPLGNNHLFSRWAHRLREFKERNKEINDPETLENATAQATFPGDDPCMTPEELSRSRSSRTPGDDEAMGIAPFDQPQEEWGEDLVNYSNAQPMCPIQ